MFDRMALEHVGNGGMKTRKTYDIKFIDNTKLDYIRVIIRHQCMEHDKTAEIKETVAILHMLECVCVHQQPRIYRNRKLSSISS